MLNGFSRFVVGVSLFSASVSAQAALTEGRPCPVSLEAAQTLVQVTAEARPGNTYTLSAVMDSQGDLEFLKYEGSRLGTTCFSVSDLAQGVLIMKQDSREVLRLKAQAGFDAKDGGTARLEYLSNGITGSYQAFAMTLERQGSWRLLSDGRAFNRLYFRNRTSFGIMIGVQRPEPSFR
jgi:hypothetical protein